MIRSRVLTPGFRLFFGIAVYALFAAFAFAVGANAENTDQGLIDSVLGPLTAGWKGGVASHVGYTVLLSTSLTAGFVAFVLIAFRDADAESQAAVLDAEQLPLTRAPYGASFAPIAGALLAVALLIGLVASTPLALAAAFGLVLVACTWTIRAWSNRATGDDEVNLELYHRIIDPARIPVVGALIVAFVVIGLSRALLAVSKVGSVVVFSVAATLFFLVAVLLSSKPKLGKDIATIVVVVGAVLVLAAAIGGLIAGQRDFHHGEEGDHSEEEGSTSEEGALAPGGITIVLEGVGSA